MAPIVYMIQTMLLIAHNDRKLADSITKQISRIEEINGLKYIVIEK
jgi:hypothetical protein